MKEERTRRKCPYCGSEYIGVPAVSREDNKTMICPDCGTREALFGLGVGKDEQDEILRTIHKFYK